MTRSPEDDDTERLLAEMLADERTEADPAIVDLFRQRPELRADIASLRAMTDDLDRVRRESAEDLHAAQSAVEAVDIEAARRALARHRPGRTRIPWWTAAAAAGVLLAVAMAVWLQRDPRPIVDNPLLGPDRGKITLTPSGRGKVDLFQWHRADGGSVVPPGGTLKVVVYRVVDGNRGEEIHQEPELTGDKWEPTPEEIDTLRKAGEIWWELRAVRDGHEAVLEDGVRVEVIGSLIPTAKPGPELASMSKLCEALATSADEIGAHAELFEWATTATVAAACRQQPEAAIAAIAAGRAAASGQRPARRVRYDCNTALLLAAVGLRGEALRLLRQHFGSDPTVDADDRDFLTIVYAHFRGTFELAQVLHAVGDFDAAISTVDRARSLVRGRILPATAEANFLEARIWIDLGVLDAAWRLVAAGNAWLDERARTKPVDPDTLAFACLVTAEYWLAQDAHGKAHEALGRYHDGEPNYPPRSDLMLARAIARLGDAEARGTPDTDAEADLRHQLLDPATAARSGQARTMLARAALRRGDHAAAQAELEHVRSIQDNAEDAWHWRGAAETEALTTRLLLQTGAPTPSLLAQQARQQRAIEGLIREWREKSVHRSGIGFLASAYRRQVLTEFIRLAEATAPGSGATVAADLLLQFGSLTSLARSLDAPEVTLADVRAEFTAGPACVLFLLAEPNGAMALAVDAERTRLFELPGSFVLDPLVMELRAALSAAPTATEAANIAKRLLANARAVAAAVLTKELHDWLDGFQTITIADHGTLSGLPWECMAWDDTRLLGERFAVNTLTSLAAGVAVKRARYRPPKQASAMAQLIGTLQPHPQLHSASMTARDLATDEVGSLLQDYPRSSSLCNAEATCARATRLSREAAVTQFLAHGVHLEGDAPGLVLAPGGDEGVYGAAKAQAAGLGGLVVLSACGLGRVPRRLGDDPLYATLGAAFLVGGAHTVVQSAADLRLQSHLQLLSRFHAGVARGQSPASALREARRALPSAAVVARFEAAQVQVFGLGHLGVVRD